VDFRFLIALRTADPYFFEAELTESGDEEGMDWPLGDVCSVLTVWSSVNSPDAVDSESWGS
jgi:hypothetical protein